jgi:hypothetical protein
VAAHVSNIDEPSAGYQKPPSFVVGAEIDRAARLAASMLAQKIALETFESQVLAVANRGPCRYGRWFRKSNSTV